MFYSGPFEAPRPVGGIVDEPGLDRVHPDVFERVVPVVLVADHPRSEALSEQCSLAPVDKVVLAGVGAMRAVERVGQVLDTGGDDRVVVRVQEAVRVERDRVVAEGRQQEVEEKDAIGVGLEEDGLVNGVRGVVEEPVGEGRTEDARHRFNGTCARNQRPAAARLSTHFRHGCARPHRCQTPDVAPGAGGASQ